MAEETDPKQESAPDAELAESHAQLGNAVDKARQGDDADIATQVREGGELFVRQFFGLLRMTKIHTLGNKAFDKPIESITEFLNDLVGLLGTVNLVSVGDQVYVNDIRIRYDDGGGGGAALERELMRHSVGGLTFHGPLTKEQVRTFVEQFASEPALQATRLALQKGLMDRGVDMVELFGKFRFLDSEEKKAETQGDAGAVASRTSDLVDATWNNVGADRMPNPVPLRRVVTEILEVGPGSGGLWEAPSGASAHGNHTLRVALLTLLLAKEAGLSNEVIQDLGVAAMFHDVGYATREGAVPAKGDEPAFEGVAPPFERHAGAGARALLRQRGFHEAKIRRALATIEHHMDYRSSLGKPSLFGRILRIAEDFDNLVRKRGGNFSPHEALGRMVAFSGQFYDPVLMQLLINSLGKYPPGTRMELDDGRVVRVVSTVRSPETFDTPMCHLESDAHGAPSSTIVEVDLATEGKVKRVLK